MVVFLAVFIVIAGYIIYKCGHLKGKYGADKQVGQLLAESKQSEAEREALIQLNTGSTTRIIELEAQLRKTVSQKKSSEVRTGLIVEQMAPFLEGFPYDPRSAIFLGKPLDFLVFDEEGVHFVEVKSGKAQLSTSQRKIRDHLKDKKVTFEVYRIKGE